MGKIGEMVIDVNDVCRITEYTVIKGDVSSLSDIRVDGTIDGKLFSGSKIVIGEKSVINGSIVCTNLDFGGTLKGDVFVKDVLSLKSTANIEGDICTKRLVVELGAKIEGNCKIITEDQFESSKNSIITTKVGGENGNASKGAVGSSAGKSGAK